MRTNFLDLDHNVVDRGQTEIIRLNSYVNLFANNDKSPLLPDKRANIIQGQPGTGTSTLAVFIIRRLMQEGRTVIYSSHSYGEPIFYTWSAAEGAEVHTAQTAPLCQKDATWILNQRGHGPCLRAVCRSILICSPNRSYFSGYEMALSAVGINYVYLPVPTEDEVAAIALLNNIPDVEARRRIGIVGRNPRLVRININDFPLVQGGIEEALSTLDLTSTFNMTQVGIGQDTLASRLFQVNANQIFESTPKSFVSEYVLNRYMESWIEKDFFGFMMFIATKNTTNTGAEYGKAFELYCHKLFVKIGGKFKCRTLQNKNQAAPATRSKGSRGFTLKLLAQNELLIPSNALDFNALQLQDARFRTMHVRPLCGNFGSVKGSVNSLILRSAPNETSLFLMTVNPDHGVPEAYDELMTDLCNQLNLGAITL